MKTKAGCYVIIEVRNGELANEEGCKAVTCAGEKLADGFYFLPDNAEDPPHRRPYVTEKAARSAAFEFEYEDGE